MDNAKMKSFVEHFELDASFAEKAALLEKEAGKVALKEPLYTAALAGALVFINQLDEEPVTLSEVASFFNAGSDDLEEKMLSFLNAGRLYDGRFRTEDGMEREAELAPEACEVKGDDPVTIENAFEQGISLYEEGDLSGAIFTFVAIARALREKGAALSQDDFLGYFCATLSNIGNIFWDGGYVHVCRHVFNEALELVEGRLGKVDTLKLDFHNESHIPVFYLLEDMASALYMHGDPKSAEKYYGIIAAHDEHDHLGSRMALQFLKDGKDWEAYVEYMDSQVDEHECGDDCDCEGDCGDDCDCGEKK